MIRIQLFKAFKILIGLIACRLVVGMSAVTDLPSAAPATSGVIHFYEPKPGDARLSDVADPLVVGGEAIFWWADLEPHEGVFDWSRVDQEIARWQSKGKRLDLRLGTAHNAPNISPAWLFDRYHIRRIGRGQWCDFEVNNGDYEPGPDATRNDEASSVISGRWSLVSKSQVGTSRVLLSLVAPGVFIPGADHSVQFDCLSITGATGWVAVISQDASVTNRFAFNVPAGERCSRSFTVAMPRADDVRLVWGLNGDGQLALDNVNVLPLQSQPRFHRTDFESPVKDWELLDGTRLVRKAGSVLTGAASLMLSNASPGFTRAVVNHPPHFSIREGQGYSASFHYKALTPATLRLQLVSKSPPFEVLDISRLKLRAGDSGTHFWSYPAFVWRTNCALEIGLVGDGRVLLDDLAWSRWSDRVTCFPDYFNPVFREKWEKFIRAFAARYAKHPGVGTISVGGFGRWEEVILDDDVHGLLDAQWLARGFTQEKYLALVVASMDLFKELFPEKPLRICLAYGLQKQNDPDFMYRRVAQAAVARGIGLKQNGLSERYDTWDDVTSASYLFNRYRFQSGVNLTYETGGLISRPSRSGDGHPLSVLNRAIIDGADNLFLYGADISTRHVHKHLPYADAMLSRSLVTTFYSRLGDFSLVNEFSPAPQPYRNQWLGLREFRADGADPLMTIKSGEPCAATRPGSPQITFDVDDRQQYHGMFGVVASVQYLDDGHDAFEMNCYNNFTRAWENLSRVQKTGTGAWKWAAFQKPNWCRSARNSGEDVHSDIVINDLGDGIEHIAGLELSFVPAREWRRELLQSVEPSALHTVITNSVSREIELPAGEPLHWIGVPLWVGSLERNSVLGRVIALTAGGEIVASEKTYAMPADKDWFEMPVVPVPGCQRYRIELSQPKGSAGWYHGTNGELAFRAWRYAAATNVLADSVVSEPKNMTACEESFSAAAPFFGVQLNLAADTMVTSFTVRLARELAGGDWSPPITEQVVTLNSGNQPTRIYCEPQTAGRYKVELVPSGKTSVRRLDRAALAQPIALIRAGDSQVIVIDSRTEGVALFNPATARVLAETNLFHLNATHSTATPVTLRLTGPSAHLDFQPPAPITTKTNQAIRLHLANRTSAPLVRVLWAKRDEPFDATRSELMPLVQNDTALREYVVPVGWNEHWSGFVERVRIEFPGNVAGLMDIGAIEIIKTSAR